MNKINLWREGTNSNFRFSFFRKKLRRPNKGSNFRRTIFSIKRNVRTLIQFCKERTKLHERKNVLFCCMEIKYSDILYSWKKRVWISKEIKVAWKRFFPVFKYEASWNFVAPYYCSGKIGIGSVIRMELSKILATGVEELTIKS